MDHITFKNYSRHAGNGYPLLQNLSFSLEKGKMIALIGLSGEGKSSLMNTIVGICPSSHKTYGEILVQENGQMVPRDVAKWFDQVGFIQQGMNEYHTIATETLVLSAAKCYGKTPADVEELFKKLRMSKTKSTQFRHLSGGEQRRVMTMIGLLNNAELNVWDEPLTGLDSEIARTVLNMMKDNGKTNLVSVHQVSEDLMKKFDQLVLLHSATVVYSGPPSGLVPFFTTHGIHVPPGVFYINYAMQLCAGNSETSEDAANIANFNKFSIQQTDQPLGARSVGRVQYGPIPRPNLARAWEIYRRGMYFNRRFRGSAILGEVLTYVINIGLFFTIFSMGWKHTNIATYFEVLRAGFNFFKTTMPDDPEAQEAMKNIVMTRNYALFIIIMVVGCLTFGLVTFYSTIGPSELLTPKYYRLCKTNIEEKQFTNVDFLSTMVIELLCKKALLPFIAFLSIGEGIFYFTGFQQLSSGSYYGHFVVLFAALACAFLIFLYNLAFNFSPCSVNIQLFLKFLCCFLFLFIPYSFLQGGANHNDSVIYTSIYGNSWRSYSNAYRSSANSDELGLPPRKGDETPAEIAARFAKEDKRKLAKMEETVTMKALRIGSSILIGGLRLSPLGLLVEIFLKVGLWMEYLWIKLDVLPDNVLDQLNYLTEYLGPMTSNAPLDEDVQNEVLGRFLAAFRKEVSDDLWIIHEAFKRRELISERPSILGIVWSLLKFLIVPGVLLSLTTIYIYRNLRPSLR